MSAERGRLACFPGDGADGLLTELAPCLVASDSLVELLAAPPAGTLVLAGAIAASHRRRVYDSVVLKVLGATRRNVMTIFILEYGLLGLVTASLASIVGSIAAWAVLRFLMGIDWVLMPQTIAVTVIGATLIILAIGVAGTWHTLGQKTAPLLRHE